MCVVEVPDEFIALNFLYENIIDLEKGEFLRLRHFDM